MTSPHVVLIDIETSPNRGWSWGGKYDQNIIRWDKEWELLSFAHKELNKGKTTCVARPDFNDESDYDLTAAAWEVCNDADILIGHNIDKFDSKKLRPRSGTLRRRLAEIARPHQVHSQQIGQMADD